MEPSSRSLYVTLVSNTSKPQFPHNTPALFKVRLPYPLRVRTGRWVWPGSTHLDRPIR